MASVIIRLNLLISTDGGGGATVGGPVIMRRH